MAFLAALCTALAVVLAMYPLIQSRKMARSMRRTPAAFRRAWTAERSWRDKVAEYLGVEEADRLCQHAGRPYGLTGINLLLYQFLFALAFMIILGKAGLFLGLIAGVVSWFMPRVLLSSMAQQRRAQIELELPSFLDLWGLLVASGEGVETALVEICRRHPDWLLSAEVGRALDRIKASGLFGDSLVEEAKVTGAQDWIRVAEQVSHLAEGGGVPSKELGRIAEQMREQRMADLAQAAGSMAVVGIFPKLGAIFLSLIPVIATIALTVVKNV